jgi:putative transposase
VIHHSDHGSQYTSMEFGKRCREAGVRPSMGSVGDAYDNAMAESFFATLILPSADGCQHSGAEEQAAGEATADDSGWVFPIALNVAWFAEDPAGWAMSFYGMPGERPSPND